MDEILVAWVFCEFHLDGVAVLTHIYPIFYFLIVSFDFFIVVGLIFVVLNVPFSFVF